MKIAIMTGEGGRPGVVSQTLGSVGYLCQSFASSADWFKQNRRREFDLLILDWPHSDETSRQTLRALAQPPAPRVPVLFIGGEESEKDQAQALADGADVCLPRPVSPDVLLARVGELIRRTRQNRTGSDIEVFGEFRFELGTRRVSVRGEAISLTSKEFDLALLLFQHLSRPLSRSHLLDAIWHGDTHTHSRTMDAHVSKLRAKLGLRPENGYRLMPIYAFGYRLETLDEVAA